MLYSLFQYLFKFENISHNILNLVTHMPSPTLDRAGGRIYNFKTKSTHFPFDFDRWYYLFKDLMAEECNIIPITSIEAKAIVNFYNVYCLNKHNSADITKEYNEVLCNITSLIQYKLNTRINKNVFARMFNKNVASYPKAQIQDQNHNQLDYYLAYVFLLPSLLKN